MSNGRLATVNGKRIVVADAGSTVAEVRSQLGSEVGGDAFIAGDQQLGESDLVKPGTSVWTVPQIVKGADGVATRGKVNGKLVVLPQILKGQDVPSTVSITGTARVNGRLVAIR